MFGYLNLRRSDSSKVVFTEYKKLYCSLCFSLWKNYGNLGRFFLSYEATFLLALLSSEKDISAMYAKKNCFSIKNKELNLPILDFLSSLSILLAIGKLDDDIKDDNSKIAFLLKKIFKRKYLKAKTDYPEVFFILNEMLNRVIDLEKRQSSIVELMDNFSNSMLEVVKKFRPISDAEANLLIAVFSWIYFIDAVDDIADDFKNHNFNPFSLYASSKKELLQSESFWIAYNSVCNRINKVNIQLFNPIVQTIVNVSMLNTTIRKTDLYIDTHIPVLLNAIVRKNGCQFI